MSLYNVVDFGAGTGQADQDTAAFKSALDRLTGAYALAVLVAGHADPVALWQLAGDLAGLVGCDVDLLDLRSATMIAETGPIDGTRVAEHDWLLEAVGDWPKDRPIVTLCACPEDASAVQAARQLQQAGYASAKPLKGGYEAWLATRAQRTSD